MSGLLKETINNINYHELAHFEAIGKTDFSRVYKAEWIKCKLTVALKKINTHDKKLFNEIKNLRSIGYHPNINLFYGVTKDYYNDYIIVLQFANGGTLQKYLENNFLNLEWGDKLRMIREMAQGFVYLHNRNIIHNDLHSKNILVHEEKILIADFGLSRYIDENDSGTIYGVLPYIAPEVLKGKPFTKTSDIYSFGVIMTEISTGQIPFNGYEFDVELAMKICIGLRPEFGPGTPSCYVELAKRCMDSDPCKRPSAPEVLNELQKWMWGEDYYADVNKIEKQFLEADKVIKSLPIPKHPDRMYTSKLINTRDISEKISGSKSLNFEIPDVI